MIKISNESINCELSCLVRQGKEQTMAKEIR